MTYAEWRRYGYTSRLSEIVATGGASKNISTANQISGTQLGVASGAGQRSADEYAQYKSLIAPLVTQQQSLASGDRAASTAAALPVISQLSRGFTASKENLFNTTPAGAGRDVALANLGLQKDSTIAGTQAGLAQQAPGILAGLGQQSGQLSLQELGAQLAGLQGGAQTNFGAGQLAAAQNASLLNFFGSLAGAVGGAAGGGIFKSLTGGGGSFPTVSSTTPAIGPF